MHGAGPPTTEFNRRFIPIPPAGWIPSGNSLLFTVHRTTLFIISVHLATLFTLNRERCRLDRISLDLR